MTEQILLLNPRRRSRRRAMPPALKRYWASRRRLSNPRRSRRRRAHSYRANPRRRHARRAYSARRTRRVYMSNPRRFRRRRRNPREAGMTTLVSDYLIPAGIGAASAVVLNIGWGYLSPSLPTQVQTGVGALAAQAGIVVVAGLVLSSAMPRSRGGITAGTVGALTVVAYNALSNLMSGFDFSSTVGGLRDYRRYIRTGRPMGRVNAYMGGQGTALPLPAGRRNASQPIVRRKVGWVSPAPALHGFNAYMRYGQRATY